MKRLICLLAALALCLGAAAQVDVTEMDAPVAGVLACALNGAPYPEEDVVDEYATDYLFFMANIFYPDAGEAAPGVGQYDSRVYIEPEEVAMWLKWAFGDRFTTDELALDDPRVARAEDGGYWIGLEDGYPLIVTCETQDEQATQGVPFAYTLDASDGTVLQGSVEADFAETGDPDTPLTIVSVHMDAAAAGILGNWTSEDGYWFSLMDEGLVFLFDGESNLLGQGTYTFEDDTLTLALEGVECAGEVDEEGVTLTIDGAARAFARP